MVNIRLKEPDLRNTIHTILTSCNLSTKYLDNVAPPLQNSFDVSRFRQKYPYDFNIHDMVHIKRKIKTAKDSLTLRQVIAIFLLFSELLTKKLFITSCSCKHNFKCFLYIRIHIWMKQPVCIQISINFVHLKTLPKMKRICSL